MDSYSSLGLKDFVKNFVICCILCGAASNRLGRSQSQGPRREQATTVTALTVIKFVAL